jgi:pimeloyl-[acyl-carrier protein] synthase
VGEFETPGLEMPPGAGTDTLEWNPFLPEVHRDPYPLYHRLRRDDPVHWNLPGVWILSRYADAVHMLRHPRMSSDFRNSELFEMFQQMSGGSPLDDRQPSMLFRDPPDHTRLRKLVSQAFSARVIEGMRPFIERTVDRLLDGFDGRDRVELVGELAHPLPVIVICEMLGVPAQDQGLFTRWSDDLVHTLDPMIGPDVIERATDSELAFDGYFRGLIAERRLAPRDDLLSALIAAEEEGERLTEEELLRTLILLLVAGHETTVNLISNGTLALLHHRDQLRLLQADPSMIRGAIEELLRYDAPVQLTGRIPLQDMEFGGKAVRRGQQVVALVGAANRDPEQFDDPDRLDIRRRDVRHIAFGGGIHFCLGASLARAEGQVAIGALVRRFRALELAAEPEWRDTITLRGPEVLPLSVNG